MLDYFKNELLNFKISAMSVI